MDLQRPVAEAEKERQHERRKHKQSRQRSQNHQLKKKKKHRDQRRSQSHDQRRQKKHKRKHSRSKSNDEVRKHKKHHKEGKDRRQRERSRSEHRQKKHKHHRSGSRDRRDRHESRDRHQSRHRRDDQRRDDSRRNDQRRQESHRKDENRQPSRRRDTKPEDFPKTQRKQPHREEHAPKAPSPIVEEMRRQPRNLDAVDPYFEERNQIEKLRRDGHAEKADQLQDNLEKQMIFDAKQREYEQMKEKFKQAQKQMQDAKREDHTILVYCLPLKAKEKDIWNFFSKAACGRIRDIHIIRDQRSGKSKGVAYVQFYTSESVEKALTMKEMPIEVKGREFTGLKIQHSQAEKNRAAKAAKQMKVTRQPDQYEQERQVLKRQTKVQVRGLVGKLENIQETELKDIFDPYGAIDYVDIHRDPETGKCKGFAFIQYSNIEDAKTAVKELNGIQVYKGHIINVSAVSVLQKGDASTGDDYVRSHGSKMALMNSLARDAPSHSNLQRPPISTVSTPFLIMTNMFKMEGTSPAYFEELKNSITEKCKEFGIIEKVFTQKNNQGNVWIKFSDTQSASKCQDKLNGQFFDGKKIFCYFVQDTTWVKRVGN